MLEVNVKPYSLKFVRPSGTSRGILSHKNGWFITIKDKSNDRLGIGECSIIEGLNPDDLDELTAQLDSINNTINSTAFNLDSLQQLPALRSAIEMALIDLKVEGTCRLFPSDFVQGKRQIDINGLIWMGNKEFMFDQIKEKIRKGFRCIKLKIGAIDFESECSLLEYIRSQFSEDDIMLRVDANGAFDPSVALERLKRLSEFDLHSIEQPIKPQLTDMMSRLCDETPLPIALDEELIGIYGQEKKDELLRKIKPQYIILKPSLLGGFEPSMEWIQSAEENKVGWWITSALESNIGLNAIAQWTATLNVNGFQGLGTGQLFSNNIPCPLYLEADRLYHGDPRQWNLKSILNTDEVTYS